MYVKLNVNDRRSQVAMLQLVFMNHILIMLDDRRARQDGVEGPKCPRSFRDYP